MPTDAVIKDDTYINAFIDHYLLLCLAAEDDNNF